MQLAHRTALDALRHGKHASCANSTIAITTENKLWAYHKELHMTDYPIDPTLKDNALAYQLYQALFLQGVSPQEMDGGYRETNYAGIHCPIATDSFCMKGTPGTLEANDVLEYAFNHDQKYNALLVKTLGEPLPWSLDDLNPATIFDEQIRGRVQEAIDTLRGILKTAGINEGTEDYKERMAVGMYYLTALPDAQSMSNFSQDPLTPVPTRNLLCIQELVDLGLGAFKEYLITHGGLRAEGDSSEGYSALEAIRRNQGADTELSKILIAVLRMAGLKPEFVDVDRENLQSDDPITQELIKNVPVGTDQICVGIQIFGGFRLLDPTLINSNANYDKYDRLTLRQYLSVDYLNRGVVWANKGDWDKAIIDYSKALEINSEHVMVYNNRGNAWAEKGDLDQAIADYAKSLGINPEYYDAYYNRGIAWANKGEWDKAIEDFTRAIEIDPVNA